MGRKLIFKHISTRPYCVWEYIADSTVKQLVLVEPDVRQRLLTDLLSMVGERGCRIELTRSENIETLLNIVKGHGVSAVEAELAAQIVMRTYSGADHSGRDVVHLALALVVDPKMTPEITNWAATKLAYFISLNGKERLVIRAAIRSLIAVLKSEPTTRQGVAVTEVLSKITELSVVDQRLFIDSGGLPLFVSMLRNSDTPLNSKELIVTTFSQIGLFFRSREAMSEAGVISALVDQPPTIELAKSTLKVFVHMSYSPDMHHRLIDAGVVQSIHRIIAQQGVTRNWKYSATCVLVELAKRPETREAMPLVSTVDLALALLDYRDDTKLAQITALIAMGYLAESRRFATQIIQRNGHVRVLRYLQDPWWHRIALEPAAKVVANLTGYHMGRVALLHAGGWPALQALPWINPDRRYGLFNLTIMPIVEWLVEHGILNNASKILGKTGPFDF